MNLTQIRYILEITSCKSFTKAAENLHVTQPAISHQLTLLEKELGCKLFVRDTHGISLTQSGKKFIYYGTQILNDFTNMEDAFELNQEKIDRLYVGLYVFHSATNLNKAILDFVSKYKIKMNTRSVETSDAIKMLENNQLDFAVVSIWDDYIPEDLEQIILTKEFLTVLLPKDNPYCQGKTFAIENFKHVPVLYDNTVPMLYDSFLEKCNRRGISLRSAEIAPDDPCMEISAVEAGFGASVMKGSTGNHFANDKLVCLPIEPVVYLNTALLYRKNDHQSKSHRLFIEHIKNFAEKEMQFPLKNEK